MADSRVSILLVDDRPEQLQMLRIVLEDLGHDLAEATSGSAALEYLLDHDPAVILLDTQMPGMDGFETASLIRSREKSRHTPIMLQTAHDKDDELISKGYALGVADYIFKPIRPEILRSKVQVFVDLFLKTEQVKRQVELLQKQEKQAALLIDRNADGILILGLEGTVLFVNPAAEELFGREAGQIVGGQFGFPILNGETTEIDIGSDRVAQLRTVDIDWEGAAVHLISLRDVTESKRAEEALDKLTQELKRSNADLLASKGVLTGELQENQMRLVQSEKLATIGTLAAGVAHEINNPIGYVSSNLGTLKEYVAVFKKLLVQYGELAAVARQHKVAEQAAVLAQVDATHREEDVPHILGDVDQLIAESAEGIRRVAEIVQSLKSFARVDEIQLQEASINEGIEATLKVVWNELKYKCQVHKNLGTLPPIRCYPGQLNQVFMNLLVNAAQAIPVKGDITIETGTDGEAVVVRVSDTGGGIPPETLHRIFDPFFTSKEVGKGTGLGLAVSHSIVEKHGGTMEVESKVGAGTTFTIRLPIEGPNHE